MTLLVTEVCGWVVPPANVMMLVAQFTWTEVVGIAIDVALQQYTLVYFLCFLLELLVQYFHYSQHNYFCKVLIMYRIMGEAGGKHVISTM